MSCLGQSRSSVPPAFWIRRFSVRPVEGQIDDLIGEINKEVAKPQ